MAVLLNTWHCVRNRHGTQGVSGRQGHIIYTAFLGGAVGQYTSSCKGVDTPTPLVSAISVPEICHLYQQTCM